MLALTTLAFAALALASPTPRDTILEERDAFSVPINLSFGVTIPTNPSLTSMPSVSYGGLALPIPAGAATGNLVSFFGNYYNNNALSSQLTSINPSAPRNTTTSSTSTSVDGGPSTSNATAFAGPARVVSTTFSSGNASSASSAIGGGGNTSTSSSSSGNSNSTSTATSDASGLTSIFTSANTADASNAQSIQNEQGAATSCAAQNNGASSQSEEVSSVVIPVGQPGQNLGVGSTAYSSCSAGTAPPQQGTSSSSGSQASLTGVSSSATCNGVTSSHQTTSTTFRINIVGTFSPFTGFSGAITGQRVARSQSSC